MKVDITFSGLDDMIKKMNRLASPTERAEVDSSVLTKIGSKAKSVMRGHIPASADNSKSGRSLKYGASSRPRHGHARDNIPVSKVTRSGDVVSIEVGWQLSDKSEYFYMKFVEWGTSKMPPREFLENTFQECEPEFREITIKEYESFFERVGV